MNEKEWEKFEKWYKKNKVKTKQEKSKKREAR